MSSLLAARNPFKHLPPVGFFICIIVLALTFLGLVILFSASQSMYSDPATLLKKQVMWLVIATLAGGVAFVVNLEALRPYAYLLAAGSVLLLVLVLVPGIGVRVNGAQRWMDFGFMRLQVSEIGKLGLLFALAHFLATNRRYIGETVRGYLAPCLILGIICGLVFLQPDFGTAFLCGAVGGIMLFLAGVRLKFLIPTAVAALTLFAVAVYHDPVRLKRITSFWTWKQIAAIRPINFGKGSWLLVPEGYMALDSVQVASRCLFCPKRIPTLSFPSWRRNWVLFSPQAW